MEVAGVSEALICTHLAAAEKDEEEDNYDDDDHHHHHHTSRYMTHDTSKNYIQNMECL
jgi:hypothetical protein